MNILYAAVVLGAMGLVFGLLLAFVNKKFAVPTNPKQGEVRDALPGANCGGCGYPGCDACAEAIADGKAPVDVCPVGGKDVAERVAAIMGVEAKPAAVKMVSTVLCQGGAGKSVNKFEYQGIHDCVAASLVDGGQKACKVGCLGFGTCARACPFDAIHMDPVTSLPVVDEEKCTSCTQCVAACPKGVLKMMPRGSSPVIKCRNTDRGKAVMDVCSIGCIGCTKCAKACPDAVSMNGTLPVVDYSVEGDHSEAARACPTGAMWAYDVDHDAIVAAQEAAKKAKAEAAAKAKAEAAAKAEA